MEKVKEVMKAMGAIPKLRLGEKLKAGGVHSFGPKEVKFLAEPDGVSKKDFSGTPQKMLRFKVLHNDQEYYWYVKVINQDGEPNYLMEALAEIKVGDRRILEMLKQGSKNYIDIREVGKSAKIAEDDEGEEIIRYDDEETPN